MSQGEQYPPCGRVLNAAWGGVYAVGSDFFLYPTVYTQPHTAFNPAQQGGQCYPYLRYINSIATIVRRASCPI